MDYSAFTNESLIMMYESIRGALASDDALEGLGQEPRFRIRTTPEWKKHAGNLEFRKCSNARSLSTSSIGRTVRLHCRSKTMRKPTLLP